MYIYIYQYCKITPYPFIQTPFMIPPGMLEKGKSEKHDEQVQYAAYKQFCHDTSGQKKAAIWDADEQIGITPPRNAWPLRPP